MLNLKKQVGWIGGQRWKGHQRQKEQHQQKRGGVSWQARTSDELKWKLEQQAGLLAKKLRSPVGSDNVICFVHRKIILAEGEVVWEAEAAHSKNLLHVC